MSESQVTQGEQGSGSTQSDQDSQGNNASNSTGNNSAGAGQTQISLPDFGPVMTAIAALPEQIAKSVKEAVGTPAKPAERQPESESKGASGSEASEGAGTGRTAGSKQTSGSESTRQPGRKTLADWWFNS